MTDRQAPPDSEAATNFSPNGPRSLADLLNRVLDRGVVLGGDVTLSVAGVDLVFLQLSALLTSVATAQEKIGALPHRPGRSVEPQHSSVVAGALPSLAQRLEPAATEESPPVPERRVPPPPRHSSGKEPAEALPDVIASEITRVADGFPERVNIDPDAVQRDLAKLVLTVVELLRRVVEHQAVRRMDDPTLSEAQIERMGVALERLDQQMNELKRHFGLAEGDLNIDLGDLGTLL